MSTEKNKNYKLKRLLVYVLFISLSVFLTVGGYYAISSLFNKNTVTPNIEDSPHDTPTVEPLEEYVNILPTYRAQYNNQNIMGRIEIPGMNIDSAVARSVNNKYYLDYNLYNQYDQIGAPFFDYRNTDLVNNRQINVYGHNTQNTAIYDKLPFVSLESYTDRKTFDTYKDIYLSLDYRKVHYEIIAIKILTDGNNEHMKLIFYSDEDFLTHTNKMLSNSLYIRDNMNITAQDKLIVIQICHFDPVGSYLLVIGKKVS